MFAIIGKGRTSFHLSLAAILLASCAETVPGETEHCAGPDAPPGTTVLAFSHTVGFRHGSISAGVEAIRGIGEEHGFTVEHTEDPSQFNDVNLARFAAVVFLQTTGDVLNAEQEAAFVRYIQSGRGYVGVHSAADTEYDWAWYGQLVGAYFESHPEIQEATVRLEAVSHPSTACLTSPWTRTDEWYNYRALPASTIAVLATLDETTYDGGTMGTPHPIAWFHHFDGGRAWYTGLGHTSESYEEQAFLDHLAGGILWAVHQ